MSGAQREKENLRVAKKLQQLVLKICNGNTPRKSTFFEVTHANCVAFVRRCLRRLLGIEEPSSEADATVSEIVGDRLIDQLSRPVTRDVFQTCMQDPEVDALLDDINIKVMRRDGLFDVLDADGSGCLEPKELVAGLMSLRGTSDRSDDVATLLGVRAVQRHLKDVHNLILQTYKAVRRVEGQQIACEERLSWEGSPNRQIAQAAKVSIGSAVLTQAQLSSRDV